MLDKALSLHQENRLDEAAALYRELIAANPRHADALHLLGVVEYQSGKPSEAAALIGKAIKIEPGKASYYSNLGLAYRELSRFGDALACYDRALAIRPNDAGAFNNRGNVLRDLGRYEEALASFARALVVNPQAIDVFNNRGAVLSSLKRFKAAIADFDRALALNPGYVEAHNNRGAALTELKRFDEALACFNSALAITPGNAETLNNRGNVLSELKRFDEALSDYARALISNPNHVQALYNHGTVLIELSRYQEALTNFDHALTIRSDFAEAHNGRGAALVGLRRHGEAMASFEHAVTLKPDYAEAHFNHANALSDLRRFDEALASFDAALAIRPDYPFLLGFRLYCKMRICDWHRIDQDYLEIAEKIEAGKKASPPSVLLATPASALLQRKSAEVFMQDRHPQSFSIQRPRAHHEHTRIRIGYFSGDFYNHATAYLAAQMFERHDRNRFEVFAFSFGPSTGDAMRARLENAFDHFIEIGPLSDQDAASLARHHEIDIAIDLKGFTQDARTGIFALGAAPIQVIYLGYTATMGAPCYDYLIADPIVIPEDQQKHYVENIVYLPDSYLVNDSKRAIADKMFTRAECGLPEEGFVFCCFNSNYKITPSYFEIWMRLLKAVDGSVMWLFQENPSATARLKAAAEAHGVAPERLIFATRMDVAEHLARHRLADLFLDTSPYNAVTTTSDALWTGLPVVTCLGETFAGRIAASLLNAAGLSELITQNLGGYEALALNLAQNPNRLRDLKQRLARQRLHCALFDTERYTKNIETAFTAMWTQHQAGLPPRPIDVRSEPTPSLL